LGLAFFDNSISAQQLYSECDTIRFMNSKFVGIGGYYSTTKIAKSNSLSMLCNVFTEFCYSNQRVSNGEDSSFYVGFGTDLSNRTGWLLEKEISKENLYAGIEVYCRRAENRIPSANSLYRRFDFMGEPAEPMLDWRKGVNGSIGTRRDEMSSFKISWDTREMIAFCKNLTNVWADCAIFSRDALKSGRNFMVKCNFFSEEFTAIYMPTKNELYVFDEGGFVGRYLPEKWRFLARKTEKDNPCLLPRTNIDEDHKINLLLLSMLVQWLLNVERIY
jgi:hypothetical protein